MPLRVFTRSHYNVLEAGGTIRWWLGGGWCKPRVPPKIAKIRLRIIRVCRINRVIRMGRLKSPYDPSLVFKNRIGYAPVRYYVIALLTVLGQCLAYLGNFLPRFDLTASFNAISIYWNRTETFGVILGRIRSILGYGTPKTALKI